MSRKLKPLTRADYNGLDSETRKLVDYARLSLAENLAAASGRPLAETLQAIIQLHERGHLAMVLRGDQLTLVPCLDGEALPGSYDFSAGGRT
jgi:hypothetical protein